MTVADLLRVLGIQDRRADAVLEIGDDRREIVSMRIERDKEGRAMRIILSSAEVVVPRMIEGE